MTASAMSNRADATDEALEQVAEFVLVRSPLRPKVTVTTEPAIRVEYYDGRRVP